MSALWRRLPTFCSFSPETLVATPDGDVRDVVAVLVHADAVTGTVVIDGELIETTPEHPFFSLDRGFVPASELRPGELVAAVSGRAGAVESITWAGGAAVMYNLTVAVDHTFFVGEGQWWVHNACGNSLASTNPQHMYEITRTDPSGLVETFKFGVSGGPITAAGNSYRATSQVNALNKAARAAGMGDTYNAVIRTTAATRRAILDDEISAVYGYLLNYGTRPVGNVRP